MTTLVSERRARRISANRIEGREAAWGVLKLAARLLLEYNARSESITQQIERVAEHLGIGLRVVVGYREVTLVSAGDRDHHVHVDELRINAAVIVDVLRVLDDLCADRIGLDEAARRLETVETRAPRYGRWVLTAMFGIAASALARLLGADPAAMAVVGASSGIGVLRSSRRATCGCAGTSSAAPSSTPARRRSRSTSTPRPRPGRVRCRGPRRTPSITSTSTPCPSTSGTTS